jgi:hypothetical protein
VDGERGVADMGQPRTKRSEDGERGVGDNENVVRGCVAAHFPFRASNDPTDVDGAPLHTAPRACGAEATQPAAGKKAMGKHHSGDTSCCCVEVAPPVTAAAAEASTACRARRTAISAVVAAIRLLIDIVIASLTFGFVSSFLSSSRSSSSTAIWGSMVRS